MTALSALADQATAVLRAVGFAPYLTAAGTLSDEPAVFEMLETEELGHVVIWFQRTAWADEVAPEALVAWQREVAGLYRLAVERLRLAGLDAAVMVEPGGAIEWIEIRAQERR